MDGEVNPSRVREVVREKYGAFARAASTGGCSLFNEHADPTLAHALSAGTQPAAVRAGSGKWTTGRCPIPRTFRCQKSERFEIGYGSRFRNF